MIKSDFLTPTAHDLRAGDRKIPSRQLRAQNTIDQEVANQGQTVLQGAADAPSPRHTQLMFKANLISLPPDLLNGFILPEFFNIPAQILPLMCAHPFFYQL